MIQNWARLNDNCPIDIKGLCDIGWEIQIEIDRIKRSEEKMDILLLKSSLNRMIKRFLGIISGAIGTEKGDKEIEIEFREAYSRILGGIDEKERELKSNSSRVIGDNVLLPLYISEIENIFIGDIYDPIKIASEMYPKDGKMFVLKAFELVKKSSLVYGGETRFKPTKRIKENPFENMPQAPPVSAEEMNTDNGKKEREARYDQRFPEYKDLNKK